jgi:hypothetical protein
MGSVGSSRAHTRQRLVYMVLHTQFFGLNLTYLQFFFAKDLGMLKVWHARQWNRSMSIRPLVDHVQIIGLHLIGW